MTTTQAEVFLLIEQPRQRLAHWIDALGALDSPTAPSIAAVVAYYDEQSEQALLNVQYDERELDAAGRRYIVNVALLAEVGMIQPAELSDLERKRFISARLARCRLRCSPQRTLVAALRDLVRTLNAGRARVAATPPPIPKLPKLPLGTPPPAVPILTVKRAARLSSPQPVLQVAAKGTRDGLENPVPRSDDPPLHVTAKGTRDDVANRRADRIDVRYLHAGRWVSARVNAIGLNGATLLAGSLPRLADQIEIAVSLGDLQATVCGSVVNVSAGEQTTAGGGVFTLKFVLDEQSRHRLPKLLIAARDAKVAIEPAPRRASQRLPVTWSVALGTADGVVKATALDVSAGGMFVSTKVSLSLGTTLTFSLTDSDGPMAGRAKVVRRISDAEARVSGDSAGFGLAIVAMTDAHRARWTRFLARIDRTKGRGTEN
jgi:hypothetical protein